MPKGKGQPKKASKTAKGTNKPNRPEGLPKGTKNTTQRKGVDIENLGNAGPTRHFS